MLPRRVTAGGALWPPGYSGEQRRPWHEACQRFVYGRDKPVPGDFARDLAVNISVSRETMRRRGFSPYGPSKAALESESLVARTAGHRSDRQRASARGRHPHRNGPGFCVRCPVQELRPSLISVVRNQPEQWRNHDEVTGKRFVATKWRSDLPGREAAEAAAETAGW